MTIDKNESVLAQRMAENNKELTDMNESLSTRLRDYEALGSVENLTERLQVADASLGASQSISESYQDLMESHQSVDHINESLDRLTKFEESNGSLEVVAESLVRVEELSKFEEEYGSLEQVGESLLRVHPILQNIQGDAALINEAKAFIGEYGSFEDVAEALTKSTQILESLQSEKVDEKLKEVSESYGKSLDECKDIMEKFNLKSADELCDMCESLGLTKVEAEAIDEGLVASPEQLMDGNVDDVDYMVLQGGMMDYMKSKDMMDETMMKDYMMNSGMMTERKMPGMPMMYEVMMPKDMMMTPAMMAKMGMMPENMMTMMKEGGMDYMTMPENMMDYMTKDGMDPSEAMKSYEAMMDSGMMKQYMMKMDMLPPGMQAMFNDRGAMLLPDDMMTPIVMERMMKSGKQMKPFMEKSGAYKDFMNGMRSDTMFENMDPNTLKAMKALMEKQDMMNDMNESYNYRKPGSAMTKILSGRSFSSKESLMGDEDVNESNRQLAHDGADTSRTSRLSRLIK